MPRDKREKRALYALNGEGMVLCNPRAKEPAHRTETEGIAADNRAAVKCRKCIALLNKLRDARRREV
jgi:hypothetical protein